MAAQQSSYRFSFVIPAYNCEGYVAEAIESVLGQDFGFGEGRIQLVVVDDGSTDATAAVCRAYADSFPGDIAFVSQENAGASAARRAGLALARGEYVNFLDADDKWSADACTRFDAFFREHPDVGFCAARHWFFGAKEGPHVLDYKFQADAVVDLEKTVDFPHLSLSNAFISRCLVLDEYFDARVAIGEDMLVVNSVLLRLERYGVLKDPVYWYRKRGDSSSALDGAVGMLSYYFETPHLCHEKLAAECVQIHGCVTPWLQYTLMYDLQWRLKSRVEHPLDDGQLRRYRETLVGLLRRIDDEVILNQRNSTLRQRLYYLSLKRGVPCRRLLEGLRPIANGLYLEGAGGEGRVQVATLPWQSTLTVEFVEPDGGRVRIEGSIPTVLPPQLVRLWAYAPDEGDDGDGSAPRPGRRWTRAEVFARGDRAPDAFFDENYADFLGFSVTVPAEDVAFRVSLAGRVFDCDLKAGKFSPVQFKRYEYAFVGGKVAYTKRGDRKRILFRDVDRTWLLKREALYEAFHGMGRPKVREVFPYRREALAAALAGRRGKRVWLISDRVEMAGDNGEALFTYLQANPVEGVETWFAVSEASPDFERLKTVGNVVAFGSRAHKKLHMKADKIISSSADEHTFNRFGKNRRHVRCFERYDFVFLQHGVTKDDIHGWLNRYKKNIAAFVTAAGRERDSIVGNPGYCYSMDDVVLTGFPRHDGLLEKASKHRSERKVLVAPTWRNALAGKVDPETGLRPENTDFEGSDYYRFWQGLLNDPRLGEAASRLGWKVDFLIHPAFAQEAHKFSSPFCTVRTSYEYRDELVSSAVMVTDYSSVAFDFALLRKPILYAQFDSAEFFSSHSYRHGYFSYESDGFGKVCGDLDATVEGLVALMEDPAMPDEYRGRADAFFFEPPEGKTRCGLVVDAILALDPEKP